MSLTIIKGGILDTVQDGGRYGYQHLGINPGGAMDTYAAGLANSLLGKAPGEPVTEIHFPASRFLFTGTTVICITGADFSPHVNGHKININQPFVIKEGCTLEFKEVVGGSRCYMSFLEDMDLEKWLNSYSTNLKVEAGGLNGRSLQKGDILPLLNEPSANTLNTHKESYSLPWKAHGRNYEINTIRYIKGQEYEWLTDRSKAVFGGNEFKISNHSDRMGFGLAGDVMAVGDNQQLVSSPVCFGTIQLLPNGQLIVLMADHQTTGGYPRVGTVISADIPILAQKKPGETIRFIESNIETAEKECLQHQETLLHLQSACKFKVQKLLNVSL